MVSALDFRSEGHFLSSGLYYGVLSFFASLSHVYRNWVNFLIAWLATCGPSATLVNNN